MKKSNAREFMIALKKLFPLAKNRYKASKEMIKIAKYNKKAMGQDKR